MTYVISRVFQQGNAMVNLYFFSVSAVESQKLAAVSSRANMSTEYLSHANFRERQRNSTTPSLPVNCHRNLADVTTELCQLLIVDNGYDG